MTNKTSRVSVGFIAAVVAITSVIAPMLKPVPASAAPYTNACTNTFLETWDWPADLRRGSRSGVTDGAGLNVAQTGYDFSVDNSSYVILRFQSNETASPKRNLYRIYTAQNNAKLSLYITTTLGQDTAHIRSTNQTTPLIWESDIISEPRNAVLPGYYVWPSGYADVNTQPIGTNTSAAGTSNSTSSTNCVYAAKNVVYESTWTFNHFSSYAGYKAGADASTSCTTLDFACKIKQAWDGVADTFAAVGEAIVNGIASIFAPDGNQIKSDFDSLGAFMEAKFGFLSYPFTFIVNIFNAFNNSTNNWCTTTSCVKNFGNFYGHAFNVDVTQLKTSVPTYYTWFTLFMRGMVVLALLLSLRQKFMKVLHK